MKNENIKKEEAEDVAEQRDFDAHLPAFNPLENQEKLMPMLSLVLSGAGRNETFVDCGLLCLCVCVLVLVCFVFCFVFTTSTLACSLIALSGSTKWKANKD